MLIGMLILAGIVIAGCLLAGAREGLQEVHKLGHPPRNTKGIENEEEFKTEEFTFHSNGLRLSAIKYYPNTESKGTIIACHYLGGSKYSIYPYIVALLRSGYMVTAFDYPNHGQSAGRKSSRYTLDNDLRRFIEALKIQGVPGPYGGIGFSMGASLILNAARQLPQMKAVVVDSGPLIYVRKYFLYVLNNRRIRKRIARLCFLVTYLFFIGFYRMSRRTRKHLKKLKGLPVLFIHGEKDRIIPIENAYRAYRWIRSENSRFIRQPRAHHMTNCAVMGEEYGRLLTGFFDTWLTGETIRPTVLSGSKQHLARIAFRELERHGMEKWTIQSFSNATGLSDDRLRFLYPNGEAELWLDAVQYAGERWIAEIRKDLRRTGAEKEPLSHLVNAYIRGSEQHPDALNAYIDLWKKAKDGDVYIQKRLAAIYREYTIQFIRMVREEIGLDPDMDTLETVAQWLTILSDVLHIQSLILGNPVDFEKMGQTVSRAVSLLLRGESS